MSEVLDLLGELTHYRFVAIGMNGRGTRRVACLQGGSASGSLLSVYHDETVVVDGLYARVYPPGYVVLRDIVLAEPVHGVTWSNNSHGPSMWVTAPR